MEIFPPGMMIDPRTAAVLPLIDRLASGSVWIIAPSLMRKSPRISGRFPKWKGSSTPGAVKDKLTGCLTPGGKIVGVNATVPGPVPLSVTRKLCATGVILVPGATKTAGRKRSVCPVIPPNPVSVKLVNPPWLKKSGEIKSASGLAVVPPI